MDAANFKQQFLPCHQKLYRVAWRLMGNAQDAEDMVQEAYLKLWKKRNELPEVANIEAYCVTLIKNLCYDALRTARPDEDSHTPEELNLCDDTSISREIECRDEANQVRKLIGQLPEQQKRVIVLRDVNDCSFEEIEQATGLNAINIRVLLSRARKKIREQFNEITKYESK
ncbi:RNA polymerase sigma factor [Phocaeicola sp.]